MIQDFGGYRLLLVTRILFQGGNRLPLVTIGYQPDLHPPVTGYHRLLARPISAGYQKIKIFLITGRLPC